jgi:hypothetical protein
VQREGAERGESRESEQRGRVESWEGAGREGERGGRDWSNGRQGTSTGDLEAGAAVAVV